MKREIRFRGKTSWGWVYGNLIRDRKQPYIVGGMVEVEEDYCTLDFWCPVCEETIGQQTNLKDKNRREIYEGDILVNEDGCKFSMIWFEGCFKLYCNGMDLSNTIPASEALKVVNFYVIGNIHDNPELINHK